MVVELVWAVMRLLGEGGSELPCRGGRFNDLGRGRLWLAVLTVLDVEAEY